MQVTITQIDTACMLIDINGFRIVTDPAFDAAGNTYQSGSGRTLKKTGSPALHPQDLGHVDLVLLSHDQHKDNLDNSGREFLDTVPRIVSTKEAHGRLGLTTLTGIDEWETLRIDTNKVPGLRVTGTPCMHGSDEELHRIAGHVLGFILEWDGQQNGALYISGDTVYFKGIEEVAERYRVDTAILHIGRAGFPAQIGDRYLTFTTEEAIRTAKLLRANKLIPTHQEGWEHFLENRTKSKEQIIDAGLEDKLVWLTPGQPVQLEI
jgi:L-ascorbate metabolism protein UlaG (beta-lactamase superfamily)